MLEDFTLSAHCPIFQNHIYFDHWPIKHISFSLLEQSRCHPTLTHTQRFAPRSTRPISPRTVRPLCICTLRERPNQCSLINQSKPRWNLSCLDTVDSAERLQHRTRSQAKSKRLMRAAIMAAYQLLAWGFFQQAVWETCEVRENTSHNPALWIVIEAI